ncbi:MAG: hypothetical protein ACLQJR_23180 [Stellaceae bacterium]
MSQGDKPDMPPRSRKEMQALAEARIAWMRTLMRVDESGGALIIDESVSDSVRTAGYADENEYWADFLSESISAAAFINRLAQHWLDPTVALAYDAMPLALLSVLRLARREGEPWFRDDPLASPRAPDDFERLIIDPRAAALWLLSKPMRRHLAPRGLAAYLTGEAGEATPATLARKPVPVTSGIKQLDEALEMPPAAAPHTVDDGYAGAKLSVAAKKPAKRGPKPATTDRVVQQMRKTDPDQLRGMKLEEMAVTFNASRETCRLTRKTVLQE